MIEINSEEEKKKITIKEIYQNINKAVTGDVLANLAYSSMIMIYFMFFNIQYEVLMIEISYKKEKDNILLYGVEFLILAIFTLLIKHIPKLVQCNTQTYILIGSYLFAIYYMLKSTILYTIEKQNELKQYSDIKEIVKDEPIKKASKRKNKKEEGK